jgi:glycine/D-amino acid oxidase-like deaminating enzyme
MAHDSAGAWRELEAVAGGATLLLACGTLDLAPEGSPLLDALDAAATAGSLGGASPLARFGSPAALAARWPALAAAPRGWEARFDGGGGALCVRNAAGALAARAERAGALTRWDDAPLAACDDRGGSFRLAFATPRADAKAATSDAGDWDWVEVEQVLLAPERAGDARAILERMHSPLLLPVRCRICFACVCVCADTCVCVFILPAVGA